MTWRDYAYRIAMVLGTCLAWHLLVTLPLLVATLAWDEAALYAISLTLTPLHAIVGIVAVWYWFRPGRN